MSAWLLLHYTLPAQPTALRVYVWRKLKRLGAILLNETVWVLPHSSRTAEQFEWLTAEIQEKNGEAYLWKSELVMGIPEDALINKFNKQVDREYKSLQKELKKKNPDLLKLSRQYQQIASADHFHSKPGQRVREKLLSLRGEMQ